MLRMVRPEMALAAGFRFTGLFDTETVSCMAGAARAKASIGIDPAYTRVGPAPKFAQIFCNNETPMTLNTSEMIATLEFLHGLKFSDKIIPSESDYGGADTLFKEGKAAMIINGDWSLGDYKGVLGDKLGAAPIPMVSATGLWPAPYTSGKFLMISATVGDDKLEAIMQFVDYLTSMENQVDMIGF